MPPDPASTAEEPTDRLSQRWRLLISALVIGHVWAVVGRPIEFATRGPTGPSPSATTFYRPVRGYSELMYLNHGYAFFAPDPGPSHLITAKLPSDDGQATQRTFPDIQKQWPRLLYHRHFMLTEFLHNLYQPPLPQSVARSTTADALAWRSGRQRYEAVRDSMRRHLAHEAGLSSAEQVQIERVEHRMPGLPEFLDERIRLRDRRLYRVLADEPLPEADAPAPEPVPEGQIVEPTAADNVADPARQEAALP